MLTFRVGSGELNVEVAFKEDNVTAKDAALEVLRKSDVDSLGDVLVVEVCKEERKTTKKASAIAGAIFKTIQLIEELETAGESKFNTTIKKLDDYNPNLRLYLAED